MKNCIVLISMLTVPLLCAPVFTTEGVVSETNAYRLRASVPRLTVNKILMKAAQKKAEDMAERGYFQHDTPEGRTPWDAIADDGYIFSAAAENIATGHNSPADVLKAWMGSPGHRRNILDRRFKEIGVGIARVKVGYVVVQLFGSRN